MNEMVAAWQRALNGRGFAAGRDDGDFGAKTLAASMAALGAAPEVSGPMRTSPAGIGALVAHEGIVPGAYRDSVGVWTFGVGHTAAAGAPIPADMAKGMPSDLDGAIDFAFDVFARDLAKYEAAVRAAIKVPVAQHEFDAAVSFHYNTGAIARADWVKALNAGDRAAAAAGIMNWTKPAEIIPRRQAEQRLFREGAYTSKPVPVWGVDSTGRIVWKPVRTISQADVIARVQASIA